MCHVAILTVSKPNLVERVLKNAVMIARTIGPTFVQIYTPCILEIGKQSMEGLQEMRDSEGPNDRFAFREYITDEAKAFLAELDAKKKGAAAKIASAAPAGVK